LHRTRKPKVEPKQVLRQHVVGGEHLANLCVYRAYLSRKRKLERLDFGQARRPWRTWTQDRTEENAPLKRKMGDEADPVAKDFIISRDVREVAVVQDSRFNDPHTEHRLQAPTHEGEEVRT
jgi:hypothetical protein